MLNKSLKELAADFTCIGDPKYERETITGISFDSRKVGKGQLFVPIVGEKVNAHKFIAQVFDTTECVASLASEFPDYTGDKVLITCSNTVDAIQEIAAKERDRIKVPVIGITGSVGKTTTREMIAEALRGGKRVYSTAGNYNSQIGVAQTVLEFDDNAEIGILELGVSMPGEMVKIAAVAKPDMAVFTNIGVTHIENLGSRENILKEKMHITDFLKDGAYVLVNDDDDLLKNCEVREGLKKISYGTSKDCFAYADNIDMTDGLGRFTCHIDGESVDVKLNVYGEHYIGIATAALAVAKIYGVDLKAAAENLSEYKGFAHRNQVLHKGNVTVIDDSYNAAPQSVHAALDTLSIMPCSGKRIAVLADMKELGAIEVEAHKEIGTYIDAKGTVDTIVTYGQKAELIGKNAQTESIHFADKEEMEDYLRETICDGDVVLFKGSNSMKLFDSIDMIFG